MKKIFTLLLLCVLSVQLKAQELNIIPKPFNTEIKPGRMNTTSLKTIVVPDEQSAIAARIFSQLLFQKTGRKLPVKIMPKKPLGKGMIYVEIVGGSFPKGEHYMLRAENNEVGITCEYGGLMHAFQTLVQLFPAKSDAKSIFPVVTISDYPRFFYRGMHLDVARHFFPVSFVKKYIDYLSMYKFNTFHWHLTDDQGWRVEIKKYPELTRVGAWRNGTIIGRYPGTGNDNTRHGGFYTQQEIKEIVRYAEDRHINIIPEIEMPGHSSAALTAYPELGCTGGPYKVQGTWGVFEEVFCAGNEKTFSFLQEVLDEVIQLFPSKLIHIGGDECPKESWKKCTKCQQRMVAEKLKDEHELQSYFIRRIEKHLNSKGRNIIGWDEILEGGLAPNATVMSWRGEEGGIEAAKQNHNVVMTPGGYCYFDHSQTKNEDSVTIGGYTSLEKVYGYEPVPKELPTAQEKYILGAQANLWTEYIDNPRKVEYMIFPRMLALSEVLWSQKEKRDWNGFEPRMQNHLEWMNRNGINYSKAYFDLQVNVMPAKETGILKVKLGARKKDGLVRHQYQNYVQEITEGKKTSTEILLLNQDGESNVTVGSTGQHSFTWFTGTDSSRPIALNFTFNTATAQKIGLKEAPSKKYAGEDGANGLVNGLVSERGIASPEWLGWVGGDMEAIIDLAQPQNISKIRVHTLEQNGSWIYLPQYAEIAVSNEGQNFTPVAKATNFIEDKMRTKYLEAAFPSTKTRYVKITVKNYGDIPSGKPGAGNKAWLFVDEVQVW
jgi:hexosaminidase